MPKAISHQHAGSFSAAPIDSATLTHEERHLRRKMLTLDSGDQVHIDLPSAISLEEGDALVLENGGLIGINAAPEELFEITASDQEHLSQLCWHIGNRHLPAQIEEHRILIKRDHVIGEMLIGLGATVSDIVTSFSPVRGAYHNHGDHDHGHDHHE